MASEKILLDVNITYEIGNLKDKAIAAKQTNKKQQEGRIVQPLQARPVYPEEQTTDANFGKLWATNNFILGDDEPNTTRAVSGRGIFGFLDYGGAFDLAPPGGFIDPAFTSEVRILATNNFNFQPRGKFGVLRVVTMLPNSEGGFECLTEEFRSTPEIFFLGREARLNNFVRNGGVLWVTNEYSGCGLSASIFNEYLSSTFGTTMQFNDDYLGGGTDDFAELTYVAAENYAPPYFTTSATCSISLGENGISLYENSNFIEVDESVCVCAFERIGNGLLVLSGDSNGTAEFPSYNPTPDRPQPEPDEISEINFIKMLRKLH